MAFIAIRTCSLPVYPVILLAAPTRVSEPSTAEQKQHQKNDQNGFHVIPHLLEEGGLALATVIHFLATKDD
jgi:hypothetical protein